MNTQRKVALVTGATAGIGKASAIALAKAGFDLALTGRRMAELDAAVRACQEAGADAIGVAGDVGDAVVVRNLFAATEKRFGRLDVLFNNAGIGAPAVPMDELSVEQWLAVVNTNLTGAFLCTREAFGLMRRQQPGGGRIINNGSISAHAPRPFSAPYTSTKHAITGLTKSTALDGRKFGITCSQIDIGNAATEMTERMTKGVLQPNGEMMIEPRMDVNHVAAAVVQIATLPPESNILFMTIMATTMPFVGRG
ncbi:SDR family oxidoreductase [Ferrovibrio sp.]|uniref:SDR family oxidoreductase n=1 Tax=Ferrovibrio sp. TaxID=1917215 RepID=UPI0025BFF296|nr:SDR family oxidoreductase [Ferrovibrio sp.]MBX3453758.1 SDR family oxidoreductase [Ferrovibrio sp.]